MGADKQFWLSQNDSNLNTQPMKTNLFKIIVFVIFGVSLAGCAGGDVNISETGFLPKPIIEPLPLKIGVFYTDEFQHFGITRETLGPTYKIQFGRANLKLFDFILSNAFKEVTVVNDLRKETRRIQNLDAIFECGSLKNSSSADL